MQITDHFLNVSLMNQLLRNTNVTVTLQWPREPGAVYHVNVSPETSLAELIYNAMTVMISLTITYNVQYNVTIVSSLCDINATKVLNYGKYN